MDMSSFSLLIEFGKEELDMNITNVSVKGLECWFGWNPM